MTNIRERAPFLSTKGVPTGGPKGGLVDRHTVVNPPGLDQEDACSWILGGFFQL